MCVPLAIARLLLHSDDKPQPSKAKSVKARQNEAAAAANAAATYSLRSVERGKVDPAAAASQDSATAQKSALPADWGFIK